MRAYPSDRVRSQSAEGDPVSWSHVNSNKNAGGGAGAANITLTGCQQGDMLLWIGSDGAGNDWETTGVTDDAGNTYRLCGIMQSTNAQTLAVFMARHATGAGTVVVNGPEGSSFTGYIAAAYRHALGSACMPILDGVKGKQNGAVSGANSFTTDAVASHSSDGLCIGVHLNDGASATLVAGTGFTLRQSQDIFTTNPLILEDKAVGAGNVASTATPGASTTGPSMTLVFTDASLLPAQTISQIPIAGNNDDESGFRTNATWAGIESGAFTADTGLTELYLSTTGSGPYFCDSTVMRFNTGAVIPANAVIQWARIVRRMTSAQAVSGGLEWKADFYDFGGSPMVAADWKSFTVSDANIYFESGAVQGRNRSVLTVQSYWFKDLTGFTRASQVNAQGLSGYTGIREGARRDAGTPSGNNDQRTAAYEHATEAPVYLEIAWYVPTAPEKLYHDPFVNEFWTNSAQGSPTRVPVGLNNIPASLQINPTAATEYVFYQPFNYWGDTGKTRICCGTWVTFDSIPGSTTTFMALEIASNDYLAQILSTGEIRLSNADGTSTINTGVIVSAGIPHWIEITADVSANPWIIQLRVDYSAPVQITVATTATTVDSGHFHIGPTGSATLSANYTLPTIGFPETIFDFIGPQDMPDFSFRSGTRAGTGGTSGNTIDLDNGFPVDSSFLEIGDTILFGVHILDSVKNSVASTGGRATRVTPWVTGEADTYGVPAFSVWKAVWDGGSSSYAFTWTDTGGRGECLTAIAISGSLDVVQSVTGTDTAATTVRDSPSIDATPGSTVVAFHGGSAVDDKPVSWRAPFYPIEDEEFYGLNGIGIAEGDAGLFATVRPGGTDATQSMWVLVELGEGEAPPEKQTTIFRRSMVIGRR